MLGVRASQIEHLRKSSVGREKCTHTLGFVLRAFSLFWSAKALIAFFSSFELTPRICFRIWGSVRTRLKFFDLRSMFRLRRAKGCASGIHNPDPVTSKESVVDRGWREQISYQRSSCLQAGSGHNNKHKAPCGPSETMRQKNEACTELDLRRTGRPDRS